MAISASVEVDGVIRAWWDDDLENYIEVAEDGVTETFRRTFYTDVEKAKKAERAARTVVVTNDATVRSRLRAGIPAIKNAITAVDALAVSSTGNTRVLATHLSTSLKANLWLARLVSGVLDSAD